MSLLSDRLQDIFESVKKVHVYEGRIIDVGSDHGYLALECLNNNICSNVICTDIHEGPAEKSRQILKSYGFSEKSEVYCTDGTDGISLKTNDTVVIAGMGGLTAIDIIKRIQEKTPECILETMNFIIQPQKSPEDLRQFLADNGFQITEEKISRDRQFFYLILVIRYNGIKYSLTDRELYYGPLLLNDNSSETEEYFEHLNKVYKVRARGNEVLKKLLEVDNEVQN